jgi:hypothetical protein
VGALLIFLINASIFALGGIGEDNSIFRYPFLGVKGKARIELALRPEFNILSEDSDFRGLVWTNPFTLKLAIPITKGFIFGAGNLTRFNQSFDIFFSEDEGEAALRGSYLFGNASEIWHYYVSNYYLVDSFLYKYEGKIFSAGLKLRARELFDVSLFGEAFGSIVMERQDSDTMIDLPARVSFGITPQKKLMGGRLTLFLEHSFWQDDNEINEFRSPYRFKLGFSRERFAVSYFYNPWYLQNIAEHGIDVSLAIPMKRIGTLTFDLGLSLKNKGVLRELRISPEIKLILTELFARRRK